MTSPGAVAHRVAEQLVQAQRDRDGLCFGQGPEIGIALDRMLDGPAAHTEPSR